MSNDFWEDWADTVRERDFRWGTPTCQTNLDTTPLAQVTIMHVRAHDPRALRPGEVSTTPAVRWAPERYVIACRIQARCRCRERIAVLGPHVCAGQATHRIISYTTMN